MLLKISNFLPEKQKTNNTLGAVLYILPNKRNHVLINQELYALPLLYGSSMYQIYKQKAFLFLYLFLTPFPYVSVFLHMVIVLKTDLRITDEELSQRKK